MKRKVVIAGPGSRFLDLEPKWISICYWPQNFESAKRFHFLENTWSLEERKFTTRNRKHGFDWNWWDPEGWNIASVEKKCQHQPLTVLMQTTIWWVDRRFPHLLLVTADPGVINTCRQDSSHAALSLDCLNHLGEFLPRARYLPVWLQIQSPTLSIWPLGQSVNGMKRHFSCFVVDLTACKDDDHVLSRKALLSLIWVERHLGDELPAHQSGMRQPSNNCSISQRCQSTMPTMPTAQVHSLVSLVSMRQLGEEED